MSFRALLGSSSIRRSGDQTPTAPPPSKKGGVHLIQERATICYGSNAGEVRQRGT
jgi:hypothetical protein